MPSALATLPRARSHERGFGLIEIIIVLAIIAVMVGVGIASLRGSKDNAKRFEARTVAHSLAEGIEQFRGDHGGRLPDQPGSGDWGGGFRSPVDGGNQNKPYVARASLQAIDDRKVSIEASNGATVGQPAPVARVRYYADPASGIFAVVVRTDSGSGFRARCFAGSADPTTTEGRRLLTTAGTDRRC